MIEELIQGSLMKSVIYKIEIQLPISREIKDLKLLQSDNLMALHYSKEGQQLYQTTLTNSQTIKTMKRIYSAIIQLNKWQAKQISNKLFRQRKFETRLVRGRVSDIRPLQEIVLLRTSPLPLHHLTTAISITQLSLIDLKTATIRI